jgi:hypothetical protein
VQHNSADDEYYTLFLLENLRHYYQYSFYLEISFIESTGDMHINNKTWPQRILFLTQFAVLLTLPITIPHVSPYIHTKAYWFGYNNGKIDARVGIEEATGSECGRYSDTSEIQCVNGYLDAFYHLCGTPDYSKKCSD